MWGGVSIEASVPPYICMPPYIYMPLHTPVHLYVPPIQYVPHVSLDIGGICTPLCFGVFRGHQYICQAFLCLSVHPFASQLITVIPVAPHHCGLLLYWTGCLWIAAMLHAVVPFFVVAMLLLLW